MCNHTHYKWQLLLISLFGITILLGCVPSSNSTIDVQRPRRDLFWTAWDLTEINGEVPIAVGDPVYILQLKENDFYSNQTMGTYELKGDRIIFTGKLTHLVHHEIMVEDQFVPFPSSEHETLLTNLFHGEATFTINKNRLTIQQDNNQFVYKSIIPTVTLTTGQWFDHLRVPDITRVDDSRFEFKIDRGRVFGQIGCKEYEGQITYTEDQTLFSGQMTIQNLQIVSSTCGNNEYDNNQLEEIDEKLASLEEVTHFGIMRDSLYLLSEPIETTSDKLFSGMDSIRFSFQNDDTNSEQ